MDPTQAPAAWPQWFTTEQAAASADYEATPAPTRNDEAWRFSTISALDLSPWTSAPAVQDEAQLIDASVGLSENSARLVFGNNALLHRDAARLPEGVILKSLEAAAHEDAELFRAFFMSQPVELGSHKFAALHKARVSSGTFLYVPKNVEVTIPIELFHWVEGDKSSVFPHTLIVCGENSKVTVLDYFRSADQLPAFACGVNDLHLERGAQLRYVAVQEWSRQSLAFHINSTIVARDAVASSLSLNFGGKFVRGESLSRLIGEGSRSEMLSLNPLDGDRQIDQRTLQDHVAPSANSDLLYLNSLDDVSKSIFAGLIKVQPHAHGTDAYQKVRNLLLTDEVEANSMPGLEILADGVRCTHGATSGQINDEEIFYLEARGIRPSDARRLILRGFFDTLLERIDDAKLRDYLSGLVGTYLESRSRRA